MTYPPAVTKKERKVLEVIARGHPQRTMRVQTVGGTAAVNALEWDEAQIGSNLDSSEFGDCIAHLVARNFIDSARQQPGMLARLRGADEKFYFWITSSGRRFLDETPVEASPEGVRLSSKKEVSSDDIDDAVRIYENSLSKDPYVKVEQVEWATKLLDDDVKAEISRAANELETMWTAFERMFGHRGPAKVGRESDIRDPVVKRAAVRVFRAKDEQRRRVGHPPSEKPQAWLTYYNAGNIGLDPPPW